MTADIEQANGAAVVAPPVQVEVEEGKGMGEKTGKKKKLHGRAFYESIGSPKYVVAPMVDQSEFVRPLYPYLPRLASIDIYILTMTFFCTGLEDAHEIIHPRVRAVRPVGLHAHAPRPPFPPGRKVSPGTLPSYEAQRRRRRQP